MIKILVTLCVVVALAGGGALAQTPSNRVQMTMAKDGAGNPEIHWQDSCSKAGTDYAVYEGSLGTFDIHNSIQCTAGGSMMMTLSPLSGDSYFLVVPLDDGAEGSYGKAGDGTERPVGIDRCLPDQAFDACLDESFVDASPERLARLDAVLDDAAAIIEAGGTYTEVATMLAAESDVEGVYSNGVSLYFSVGGIPTSIYDGIAARHDGPLREVIPPSNPVTAQSTRNHLGSNPIPASAVPAVLPRGQRMVGKDDDGDGFRDLPKHALILSPWNFSFAPNDSSDLMNTLFNGIHDYQVGSVTYERNTQDLVSASMQLADYTDGWEEMDFIFLSSHGDADPNARWGPAPTVYLGIGGASCSDAAIRILNEVPDPADRPGLYCSVAIRVGPGSNPITGRDTHAAGAFWEHHHGGKLDKKVIYLETCRSAFHPGLAEALVGTDSIFFGWSEYVYVTTSLGAADALVREAVEDGFTMLRSFVRECSDTVCVDPPKPGRTAAELRAAWHRADLRLRDTLNIPTTPVYAGCAESATLPVEQSCPSCGGSFAMSITYDASVEGLEADELTFIQDPLEFGKYQLRLFADVDQVESGYAEPLWDFNMIDVGNGVYQHNPWVTLFMDNICPWQVIEYNPWVLLPAFDEAMPGNDARDRIYSWDGPFTIEIVPTVIE